jgi:hypothetical protein
MDMFPGYPNLSQKFPDFPHKRCNNDLARLFHFDPLPLPFFFLIGAVVLFYVTGAEVTRWLFYKRARG